MDSATSSGAAHRDLVTVDLRGMKPALLARAAARGVSASAVVREALAAAGVGEAPVEPGGGLMAAKDLGRVRVALRLAADEARELAARAAKAGLPVGAFVVAAVRASGDVPSAAERAVLVAALTRSNAELSATSRNMGHLSALLRHGAVDAARQYRESLDTVNADVRAHLTLAAGLFSAPVGDSSYACSTPEEAPCLTRNRSTASSFNGAIGSCIPATAVLPRDRTPGCGRARWSSAPRPSDARSRRP
jgi:hypothetical protein